MALPSGRIVRGRGLHYALPAGPLPDFAGVYLLGKPPPVLTWESRWVHWRDLRLPTDSADAMEALVEAWRRAASERVEVACMRGIGRTGTALACIAILERIPPAQAVSYVAPLPASDGRDSGAAAV